jgi:hypothetical protein
MKAAFIPPVLLLRTEKVPHDRKQWAYELKSDGFRSIAFKTAGRSISVLETIKTSVAHIPALLEDSPVFQTRG